jgi:hypothetical protein
MFAAGLGWQVNNNDMPQLEGMPFAVGIFFLIMAKKQNYHSAVANPPLTVTSPNPEPQRSREFLRLPPAGRRCIETGLSRSALNSLILASAANDYHPPVRSYSLRRPGNRFGSRIIDFQSLRAFIHAHAELSAGPTSGKKEELCR